MSWTPHTGVVSPDNVVEPSGPYVASNGDHVVTESGVVLPDPSTESAVSISNIGSSRIRVVGDRSVENNRGISIPSNRTYRFTASGSNWWSVSDRSDITPNEINAHGYIFVDDDNAIYEVNVADPYDFRARGQSASIGGFERFLTDTDIPIVWDDTGHYFFTRNQDSNRSNVVKQYYCDASYELSTASLDETYSIGFTVDQQVASILFTDTGETMYVGDQYYDQIYEYTLSTPFDIGTAGEVDYFNFDSGPYVVHCWNDDGTKFYATSRNDRSTLNSHSCSTAFDLTTHGSAVNSLSKPNINKINRSSWSEDGTVLLLGYKRDDGSGVISRFDLSTAFDLSSASEVYEHAISSSGPRASVALEREPWYTY